MKPLHFLSLSTLLAAMFSPFSALASSQDIIEAVQAAILASGSSLEDGPLVIEEPARNYYHFGAVMDWQHKVLTVTPGSDAERASIKAGDTILQINDAALNSTRLVDILAILNDFEEGKPFNVKVNRSGKVLNLKSTVTRRTIPAWRLVINPVFKPEITLFDQSVGCSFISVFYAPPSSREFFPADIRAVGETSFRDEPFRRTDVVKVESGVQKIELQEMIASSRIRRHRQDVWERQKQLTQTLELKLEPNKVYHLASRYFYNMKERTDPSQYWQPVVWKVTDRQCE